jgi:hypothetical protein
LLKKLAPCELSGLTARITCGAFASAAVAEATACALA